MIWVLALLSVAAAVPLGWALGEVWGPWTEAPYARPFVYGALGGVAGAWLVGRLAPMLAILEHELTHLLVALLLLRRPLRISADGRGGETVYEGRGSTLIRLAPYVLPTFTLLALPLASWVHPAQRVAFVVVLGVTWGFHVYTGVAEAHPSQPDLARGGRLPSYLAVLGLSTLFYPGSALAAVGGWPLVSRWLDLGYGRALNWVVGLGA